MKYNQPFWVGRSNPRFPHARHGYLPALERDEPPPEPVVHYKTFPYNKLDQIEGMLINTREKLQQHLNPKKKPSSYSYIYNNIVLDESETAENVAEKDPNV